MESILIFIGGVAVGAIAGAWAFMAYVMGEDEEDDD